MMFNMTKSEVPNLIQNKELDQVQGEGEYGDGGELPETVWRSHGERVDLDTWMSGETSVSHREDCLPVHEGHRECLGQDLAPQVVCCQDMKILLHV